ncbi:MAG: hypothetical protein RLZZ77_1262 [Bacteroidota bacterium]
MFSRRQCILAITNRETSMTRFYNTYRKLTLFTVLAISFIALSAAWSSGDEPVVYHKHSELTHLKMLNNGLPVGDNGVFIGSGKCAGCHGIDPVNYANLTSEGVHVSPTEDWRASMMANSAKDPFWKAKVAHETTTNPGNAQELVNKCTSCHSPVGRYTNLANGIDDFTMAELAEDSLARDGVNCGACHQQRMENLGNRFSGELSYHTDTIWGPYVSEEMSFPIFSAAMTSFVGYEPVGNHKVSKSEFCAGCHTLSTHTADLSGNLTGGSFIEQATYHEWLNSSFNNDDPAIGKECQGCHMPRLDEPIVIASGYSFLPGREPFGQHWLVGGNSFMLELMKNRINELGITATTDHFDTVIARTLDNLQNHTATVEVTEGVVDGDTARYNVKITNLAGHKLPSGYPSRRAYVEFIVTDDNGNELFHSGAMNSNYEVVGNDPGYEPHHDLITAEDQVQIYEMVMGDVNGNPTTVLERGAMTLKDNRLVPLGFSTNHAVYDTTAIVGGAEFDPNFNRANNEEGSGTDEIRFHVPVTGYDGQIHVTAKLFYQSLPPRWMEELFATDHPTINAFETMYNEEGADPVEVDMDDVSSTVTGVGERSARFTVMPNPTTDGLVYLNGGKDVIQEVLVYDSRGKLVSTSNINATRGSIQLPSSRGNYMLCIITNRGKKVEKVLRQ